MHSGAEFREGDLRVVASAHRFDDRGRARSKQSSKEHRRFHLGAGYRKRVFDGVKRGAGDCERGKSPLARMDARAHLFEWLDHAAHGAPAQRSVAGDLRGEWLPREGSGEKAQCGAGILGIEGAAGLPPAG